MESTATLSRRAVRSPLIASTGTETDCNNDGEIPCSSLYSRQTARLITEKGALQVLDSNLKENTLHPYFLQCSPGYGGRKGGVPPSPYSPSNLSYPCSKQSDCSSAFSHWNLSYPCSKQSDCSSPYSPLSPNYPCGKQSDCSSAYSSVTAHLPYMKEAVQSSSNSNLTANLPYIKEAVQSSSNSSVTANLPYIKEAVLLVTGEVAVLHPLAVFLSRTGAWNIPDMKAFHCKLCKSGFNSRYTLRRHLNSVHAPRQECVHCGTKVQMGSRKDTYHRHIQTCKSITEQTREILLKKK